MEGVGVVGRRRWEHEVGLCVKGGRGKEEEEGGWEWGLPC